MMSTIFYATLRATGVLFILLSILGSAQADTFVVDPNNGLSIRETIERARNGDRIEFLEGVHQIDSASPLYIDKRLDFVGPKNGRAYIRFSPAVDLDRSGLLLRSGGSGSTFQRITFDGQTRLRNGPAFWCGGATFELIDVTFLDHIVFSINRTLEVEAQMSEGTWPLVMLWGCEAKFRHVTFTGNDAIVLIRNDEQLSDQDNNGSPGALDVIDSVFEDNARSTGIYTTRSALTIVKSKFLSNYRGVLNVDDAGLGVEISDSEFHRNAVSAITNIGQMKVEGVRVSGGGYGIVSDGITVDGSPEAGIGIENSLIYRNRNTGITAAGSDLRLINSAVVFNEAAPTFCGIGGVLSGDSAGRQTSRRHSTVIINSNIFGNEAQVPNQPPGCPIAGYDPRQQLAIGGFGARHTAEIRASNIQGGAPNAQGVSSAGTFLYGDTSVSSENVLNVNPQFVDQAAADFRLSRQSGSALIDAGEVIDGVHSDVRGSLRPVLNGSRFDIGPYEYSAEFSGTEEDGVVKAIGDVRANAPALDIHRSYTISWRYNPPFPANDDRLRQRFGLKISLVDENGREKVIRSRLSVESPGGTPQTSSIPFTPGEEDRGRWRIRIALADDERQATLSDAIYQIRTAVPAEIVAIGTPVRPKIADPARHVPTLLEGSENAAFWHARSGTLYATEPGIHRVEWKDGDRSIEVQEWDAQWPDAVEDYQIYVANSLPVDLSRYRFQRLVASESPISEEQARVAEGLFESAEPGLALLVLADTADPEESEAVRLVRVRSVSWNDPNHLVQDDRASVIGRPLPQSTPSQVANIDLFRWSFAGPRENADCILWEEPEEPTEHAWGDNYLCHQTDLDIQWSSDGPISGMRCTRILETSDPNGWENNFLCVTATAPISFSWSSAGPIPGRECRAINEPSDPDTWSDNYLCIQGFRHDNRCGNEFVYHERSRYWEDVHERLGRDGPIIPVNTDRQADPNDDLVTIWYERDNNGICWPSQPVRRNVTWPINADRIVIASQEGTGPIDPMRYADPEIYRQNDPALPGFNPNDEHALIRRALGDDGNAVFALRDDYGSEFLGDAAESEPYVLLAYTDPQDNERDMEVFRVVAEDEEHQFRYGGTAGTLIQAPYPLSLGLTVPELSTGVSGPYWKDRKGDFWAKAAGAGGGPSEVVLRYFYKLQPEFDVPTSVTLEDSDNLPWLDLRAGTPGAPIDVSYLPDWPDDLPTLLAGETLLDRKRGLPQVDGPVSVEVIYQESPDLDGPRSVTLFDPIRQRSVELATLPQAPNAIEGAERAGDMVVFATLPQHLRDRLRFNATDRRLTFRGTIRTAVSGESPYLLPNVMSARDRDEILALSEDPQFRAAVNALFTETQPLVTVDAESETKALRAFVDQPGGRVTLAFNNTVEAGGADQPVEVQIIQVSPELYRGDLKVIEPNCAFDEKLTLRHSGDFAGEVNDLLFQWRTTTDSDGAPAETVFSQWDSYTVDDPQGAVEITIEGPGLQTVSDNWFAARYCDTSTRSCEEDADWSPWTPAQIAEGWIKRVVGRFDAFRQRQEDGGGALDTAEERFRAYRERSVNTIVSMISQAGPRWEGDVPLTCTGLQDFGLIEIYETVLGRGKDLSINATPPIDYAPANTALLFAASRIADLYMLLGNEAYADAADPTIAFGTGTDFAQVASSIHSFAGVTSNLLQEELELLRGRDKSRQPPIDRHPYYNRLIWNINNDQNGETAYVLNYGVRDVVDEDGAEGQDGAITEADAAVFFPQGHGDAWGHYLTAIKGYYGLLRNDNYTWLPRAETVLVAGSPVTVDFSDERKFAKAAAARARTGAEIVGLTYRERYVDDPAGQWQGYNDDDAERAWGVSEWATRAGQGAYFDWAVGNALLPDNDPDRTGIAKIDRGTVRELAEIASTFEDIQAQLDNADGGLNPLGLARNVVPFDINPNRIDQGQTHFEQIYGRAVTALNNAISVFNYANNNSQLLRQQSDEVSEFQRIVQEREVDFNNRLIEIYGTPYPDDIGPGGAYPSGYDGPDFINHSYIETQQLIGDADVASTEREILIFDRSVGSDGSIVESEPRPVRFAFSTGGLELGLVKPSNWGEQREAPGELQLARMELLQARLRFEQGLVRYDDLLARIDEQVELLQAQFDLNASEINILEEGRNRQSSLNDSIRGARQRQLSYRTVARNAVTVGNAYAEALPTSAGFSIDATSTARSAIRISAAVVSELSHIAADIESIAELDDQFAKELAQAQTHIRLTTLRQEQGIEQALTALEQTVRNEVSLRLELYTLSGAVQQAAARYRATLARGVRLQEDLLRFRRQTAAEVQEYRYKDMAFRIFRNDALQKYRAQFDLAAMYVYLAAKTYDFETNLLGSEDGRAGSEFLSDIVRRRAIGKISDGQPVTGNGAGLADVMARLSSNWTALEGRFGFNNPKKEERQFSLKRELFRIDSDEAWRDTLRRHVVDDIFAIPEVQRYVRPFSSRAAQEPGIVIPFTTNINAGLNFFGNTLAGRDSAYDSSRFATKIRGVGVWFSNYDQNTIGGLARTPYVYLIPVGADVMRTPSGTDFRTREWVVVDQSLPTPFGIGEGGQLNDPDWRPISDTLAESLGRARRHPSFRAYHDAGDFNINEMTDESRLIGRSVWNTRWLLVIPAVTLLGDREEALETFIDGAPLPPDGTREGGITDILLSFLTYSYAGD